MDGTDADIIALRLDGSSWDGKAGLAFTVSEFTNVPLAVSGAFVLVFHVCLQLPLIEKSHK